MNRTMIALVASLSTLFACHAEGPPSSTAADANTAVAAATTAATAASASPAATTAATPASASPIVAKHDRPFKDLVAGAQALRVIASEPTAKTVEVKVAKDIAAIVDALGASQSSTAGEARCRTPFSLIFLDGAGKTLAAIDLCDSAGLAESNKPLARLSEPRDQAGGFTVANLGALRTALKPLGIDLP